MGAQIFEYADFSGGDYGRLENWRAPKNSFSAQNMLVYRTGELGVRAGVRNVTPPGVAVGTVLGLGRLPDSLSTAFYVQGTATKIFDAVQGGTLSTASGALTGTPSVTVHMDDAGHTVYIASSANGYSLAGTTVTSLNNMPAADAIALYGDRLAVVPSSAQNTVQFSAAASFNNWTISAGNAVSITVGDSDPITALLAQRSHLVIFKKTSGIYILSGTPGTNESLRLVSRGTAGPTVSRNAGRTRADDKVWYAATNQQQLSNFDGTNYAMQDNIPVSLYTELAQRVVAPLRLDDQTGAAFLVKANAGVGAANEIWLKARGIWTRHTFGVTLDAQVASAGVGFPQDGDTTAARLRYGSMLVLTDGGGAAATPNFYSWVPFLDRPGLEASPFSTSAERPGDDSAVPVTGSATLAEQRDKDGRDIQVRGVIVDFRSWNTGSATNNHFDLVVNTLNSYESSAPISSATASFDEAASQSALAGSVRSKYFSFGDQGRGGAFNVQLSNVRGVAFQRFRVVTETYPGRV
jgi:hypothetical protein